MDFRRGLLDLRINVAVGNEQVQPAVVVIISSADRKILALRLQEPGFRRHIGESTVAIVVVESVRTPPVFARRTTAKDSSQVAITFITQVNVAADIKIEPAIAVV